jgi:hypothetical protein
VTTSAVMSATTMTLKIIQARLFTKTLLIYCHKYSKCLRALTAHEAS